MMLKSFKAKSMLIATLMPLTGFGQMFSGTNLEVRGDFYYLYNFNDVANSQDPANNAQNTHRMFDRASEQFQLNEISLGLSRAAEPFGYEVIFGAGTKIDVLNQEGTNTVRDTFRHLRKGVGHWQKDSWRLDFGWMDSYFGYEEIDQNENINYSHSLLFKYTNPKMLTGVRLNKEFSAAWSSYLTISNGEERHSDNNSSKSFNLGLRYMADGVKFGLDGMAGPENTNNSRDNRYRLGMHFEHVFSEGWKWALDAAHVWSSNHQLTTVADGPKGFAKFGGAALYLQQFRKSYSNGLRLEWFADIDGGAFQTDKERTIYSATFTHVCHVSKELDFTLEARHDFSKKDVFENSEGVANQKETQTTILGALTFSI